MQDVVDNLISPLNWKIPFDTDKQKGIDFANLCELKMALNFTLLMSILFSDDRRFALRAFTNKQNYRICGV